MIKVRIQATERVHYGKTVEMTKQQFNELRRLAEESNGKRFPISADEFWFDPREDVEDGEGLEDIIVEIAR